MTYELRVRHRIRLKFRREIYRARYFSRMMRLGAKAKIEE